MAKDPAFTWYAQDFIVDTIQWTRAMQGLHCYLLSVSWINRGLTVDSTGVPTGLVPEDVEIWHRIKHKWQPKEDRLISVKQEEVREKRKNFILSQSEKGKASAAKRKFQPGLNPGTGVEPSEREKENEIVLNNIMEWGKLIVEGQDQYWDAMKGRKISQKEMDVFLSVATRNKWKLNSQAEFRLSLKGFEVNGEHKVEQKNKYKYQ